MSEEVKELVSIICEGQDTEQRRKVENLIEYQVRLIDSQDKEIERLNNIINELEKDIKNLYTYGIKNNAEQRDYLLNRLQELKGSDKE